MNILLAVDGSRYTKKALAFLLANENLRDPVADLLIFHAQSPLPPHVAKHLGQQACADYYRDQAQQIFRPIDTFMRRHEVPFSTDWKVGVPSEEILKAARKHKAHLIVMGTHGHGLLGRMLMGSVAQRVVADSPVPVLLVK